MNTFKISNHMIRDEIEKSIENLNISRKDFHEVGKNQWQHILLKVIDRFVMSVGERSIRGLHWAWNNFNEVPQKINFDNNFTYQDFGKLIHEDFVWFIAEDTFDKMWIYEAKATSISLVLDECSYFEYYIVSQKYDWLICENHHGSILAVGSITENITSSYSNS